MYIRNVFITLAMAAVVLLFNNGLQAKMYVEERDYARARIEKIEKVPLTTEKGITTHNTMIHLKVLDGKHKGTMKRALFGGESDMPIEMSYRTGDVVFIGISRDMQEGTYGYVSIYDQDNTVWIILLLVIMVGSIIAVGRLKGLASLAALMITIGLVFMVLLPVTLKGYPPLPVAVGIAVVSILVTMPIIMGFQLKTLGAVLGASGGVILASILSVLFGYLMHLSGIVTSDMLMIFYASDVAIDLRGLVLSGMIIAALGAIMDIAISIASSTSEIYNANPDMEPRQAYNSVITIGRDILGSMVNTLVLAYVGSSLAMVLWIAMKINPDVPFWMVLNYNPVLSEIVKSAVGSIGMFLSIPLTAAITVQLYYKKKKK